MWFSKLPENWTRFRNYGSTLHPWGRGNLVQWTCFEFLCALFSNLKTTKKLFMPIIRPPNHLPVPCNTPTDYGVQFLAVWTRCLNKNQAEFDLQQNKRCFGTFLDLGHFLSCKVPVTANSAFTGGQSWNAEYSLVRWSSGQVGGFKSRSPYGGRGFESHSDHPLPLWCRWEASFFPKDKRYSE